MPDETTVCRFRHLLEAHDLGQQLFDEVQRHLASKGLKVATGTIVDATIINAPSSTKNADKARDPEMHQTKKGNQWYFGMKAHFGVDSRTKLIHAGPCEAQIGLNAGDLPGPCAYHRAMLINDLADIDNEVFVFLDDYHLVTDPAIRRAVSFLLRHAPSHLHLVLTTRLEPHRSFWLLGPAVKNSVSELDLAPPPRVRVHSPSIVSGLPSRPLS